MTAPLKAILVRGAGLLVTLTILTAAWQATAQPEASEYEVKAAFLYQFISYIEWPEDSFAAADSPFTFGIMGAEEVAEVLEAITMDPGISGNQPALVRRLNPGDPVTNLQVLFVGRTSAQMAEALLLETAGLPMLTVTESNPRPQGSVINFEIVNNRVRFDIALTLARQRDLGISARLLQVASRVIEED